MNIVIYGAQGIALGAYKAIRKLHPEINISCFLVSKMDKNASALDGIPVRELSEFVDGMTAAEKDNIEVLIGTPENVMDAIENGLEAVGIKNHVRLDSMKWADMQKMAFTKSGEFMPLTTYPIGCREASLKVYKIIHCLDKPLKKDFNEPEFVVKVQVGAINADRQISDMTDAQGESISDKNGNYSELTGLYWIWKNQISKCNFSDREYIGLVHYRRLLELSVDDRYRLVSNDIDVVLPYPMPYEPNIEEHHKRYLSDREWECVLCALNELQPEYASEFRRILKQGYLYNYNIIIAKTNVLIDYCEWLFPLLFMIEEINDPDGIKEPNRYIGYVGETLETLYFMHNKDKLRIAHTGCRFLS